MIQLAIDIDKTHRRSTSFSRLPSSPLLAHSLQIDPAILAGHTTSAFTNMDNLTTGFPFLKLPLELRIMIYKELVIVFSSFNITVICRRPRILGLEKCEPGYSMSPDSLRHPIFVFFLVSKQTRQEAISVYYGGNRFNAQDSDILAGYLQRIGPDACNAIREISIRYETGKNAAKAFKLLAQCGSLRKLHFTIDWLVVRSTVHPVKFVPLLKRPGLPSLLKVRGIEELNVEVKIRRRSCTRSDEFFDSDKESFIQSLQILKEPRDVQKKEKRLPPKRLYSKVPMMTRARASRKKEQSTSSNTLE